MGLILQLGTLLRAVWHYTRYAALIVIRTVLRSGAHTKFAALCLILTAVMSTDSETLWHCLSGTAHSKKFDKLQPCLSHLSNQKNVYGRRIVAVSVVEV